MKYNEKTLIWEGPNLSSIPALPGLKPEKKESSTTWYIVGLLNMEFQVSGLKYNEDKPNIVFFFPKGETIKYSHYFFFCLKSVF
jgi:hypothetical protein